MFDVERCGQFVQKQWSVVSDQWPVFNIQIIGPPSVDGCGCETVPSLRDSVPLARGNPALTCGA